ncbi:MAG TPA: TRAP transporter large permease [Alphaproteobacteria bacterium]|nr:TRAP transporter large permease [Alphaproteobacteria bacterium]
MTATIMFALFFALLLCGTPIAPALGLAGVVGIWLADMSLFAVPTNVYAGIAKYPILAVPMFVLAGAIFDRSGVAARLVNFAAALVGRGRGSLAVITVVVAMFLGGISGSGPANAAAVGGVMMASMTRAGYPKPFSASVIGAAAATDILIPPSIAFIIYSVLVPQATVPALFAAGIVPGILAGLALILPIIVMCRYYGFGDAEKDEARPPIWQSFKQAIWGLMAPVLILGGMRSGWFTPTEAAVMAVIYGLFVGIVIYRSIGVRDIYSMLVEAGEISAVILIVVALASIFAWASNTLGIVDPIAKAIVNSGLGEYGVLGLLILMLIVIGMFLDGVSTFLILLPLLVPIANTYQWDLVWFGVILTMKIAIGQFTPPMAVNLMVSCKIANVPIESTVRWVGPLILAMFVALALVIAWPPLALWLPDVLGYR